MDRVPRSARTRQRGAEPAARDDDTRAASSQLCQTAKIPIED
jgi:hypothetical protein